MRTHQSTRHPLHIIGAPIKTDSAWLCPPTMAQCCQCVSCTNCYKLATWQAVEIQWHIRHLKWISSFLFNCRHGDESPNEVSWLCLLLLSLLFGGFQSNPQFATFMMTCLKRRHSEWIVRHKVVENLNNIWSGLCRNRLIAFVTKTFRIWFVDTGDSFSD